MYDTHAHVNFNAYKEDADEVIKRSLEKGIGMINVGSQYSTSERAVKMAEKYDNVYASVGLHPFHLEKQSVRVEVDDDEEVNIASCVEDFDFDKYFELGKSSRKVKAVGEAGLDYFYMSGPGGLRPETIERQKQAFRGQIKLADALDLPLIVHCRGTKEAMALAYQDILGELKAHSPKKCGVMHCYIGSVELIPAFAELGFYFGFNGVLTFDKTGLLEKILLAAPEDRIVTETDCPYLTPAPFRGKRNEPAYIEYIVKKIVDIKGISQDEVARLTHDNAERLFRFSVHGQD